jgi:tripartite-type tricarboxylate transporter receptor subunit TctC
LADFISRGANEALKMDDVQSKFRAVGVEPIGGTPAAMATFVTEESQRWGDVIRKNNIVLE